MFLRILLVILPVGAIVVVVVVVVATSPTTTLVAPTWEIAPSSAPEVIGPPEAAVVAPELSAVLVPPWIFLVPIMGWRVRS